MKKSTRLLIPGTVYLLLFVVLAAVLVASDFGPLTEERLMTGQEVGFEEHWLPRLNLELFKLYGESSVWYDVSEILGYVSFLFPVFFAGMGALQLWKRKSLKKVDRDLFFLAGLYGVTVAIYALFEVLALNYRPVLEDGEIAASFPSSHVFLVLVLVSSAVFHLQLRIRSKSVRRVLILLGFVVAAPVCLGRLLSGVHWFSDVFGGILISGALIFFHKALVLMFCRKGTGKNDRM